MKRLRNVMLSLAMLFVIVLSTACSSKETTATKTFVKEQNGVKVTLVYTYIEKDDKVVKQTSKTEALFSAFQGRDIEQLKKQIQDVSVEVDYTDFDYEKAKGLPGMVFTGNPSTNKVSMEKSAEMLKSQGFEEQK